MSKYGVDEQGWPLVPVDPAATPDGYEPVRVGWPIAGEWTAMGSARAHRWSCDCLAEEFSPYVIIRPIPKPIRLPLAIVPHGWWVAKDCGLAVFVYENKPSDSLGAWSACGGKIYRLPPWIAANLPQEWHDLPWDQSAVQQQEGGEG